MKVWFRWLAILLIGSALPSRSLLSQTPGTDPLGRRISVKFDRLDLATALTRLRTVFGIPLAFATDAVPDDRADRARWRSDRGARESTRYAAYGVTDLVPCARVVVVAKNSAIMT